MLIIRLFSGSGDFTDTIIGFLAFMLVALFSISVHEASHAYGALLLGDATAKSRGRLTLNPASHLDLTGALMFLVAGFGWAKPVPVDTSNFTNYKKGRIVVSLAGVVSNIAMALIWLLLLYLAGGSLFTAMFTAKSQAVYVLASLGFYIIVYGVMINFMLAMFNLLPIYPLDGFNLLDTFLPYGNPFSRFMVKYGFFVLIGLIALGWIGGLVGVPELSIFGLFGDLISRLVYKVLFASLGFGGV
ncbi:MAG: site-2 protease family protein [Firmicutes bacterium]|nr:site-2 protease family protein [Bacillota bacterium]